MEGLNPEQKEEVQEILNKEIKETKTEIEKAEKEYEDKKKNIKGEKWAIEVREQGDIVVKLQRKLCTLLDMYKDVMNDDYGMWLK